MDYKQHEGFVKYIKKLKSAEKMILSICPDIPNKSGIYLFYREEKGIKYGYVGQSLDLKKRCCQHLIGFQHIDNSLKNHGLYDELKNPNGYKLWYKEYSQEELDKQEQFYIDYFANKGLQLRNKKLGGQSDGNDGMDTDRKPTKTYREGVQQGYENCRKEIITMFTKYLNYSPKGTGKIAERKLQEFRDFLNPVAMERLERIENLKEVEDNGNEN